jgi:hypothetical protein
MLALRRHRRRFLPSNVGIISINVNSCLGVLAYCLLQTMKGPSRAVLGDEPTMLGGKTIIFAGESLPTNTSRYTNTLLKTLLQT